ncbi:hypothetical protein Y032_0515g2782 [Ancylostoma ceylanicum]|uniref:Uncharacterized protein n=1 Tax=Ancylostoma ceylanicum TaxID=53326 RepID=A0A016WTA7_9BILA|nr:hypothetical protein Y032_0515g2782 [Ancylostoma ceylanicum]
MQSARLRSFVSTASKSTRRDRATRDGIIDAVANLDFLHGCSLHLMLNDNLSNYLSKKPHSLLPRRGFVLERCGRAACFLRSRKGRRHRRLLYMSSLPATLEKKNVHTPLGI